MRAPCVRRRPTPLSFGAATGKVPMTRRGFVQRVPLPIWGLRACRWPHVSMVAAFSSGPDGKSLFVVPRRQSADVESLTVAALLGEVKDMAESATSSPSERSEIQSVVVTSAAVPTAPQVHQELVRPSDVDAALAGELFEHWSASFPSAPLSLVSTGLKITSAAGLVYGLLPHHEGVMWPLVAILGSITVDFLSGRDRFLKACDETGISRTLGDRLYAGWLPYFWMFLRKTRAEKRRHFVAKLTERNVRTHR